MESDENVQSFTYDQAILHKSEGIMIMKTLLVAGM